MGCLVYLASAGLAFPLLVLLDADLGDVAWFAAGAVLTGVLDVVAERAIEQMRR